MSSRRNSIKKHSEYIENLTTPSNSNIREDNTEKSISLNEFLDFLNLSCHVNDMISQNSEDQQQRHINKEHFSTTKSSVGSSNNSACGNRSKKCGVQSNFDFKKFSQNRLVNGLYEFGRNPRLLVDDVDDSGAGSGFESNSMEGTAQKSKLSSNIEGVLPFICPVPLPPNYTSRLKLKQPRESKESKSTSSTNLTSEEIKGEVEGAANKDGYNSKPKSKLTVAQAKSTALDKASKKENEVVIHVCDEVKNISKDFTCPQSLLVSKMGYFSDVTAGQKLEDMDISVHCDIQIFEWLMKWVKSEDGNENTSDEAPNLSVNNVIPILVSASFLKMEPLLLDCLSFCHSRLGEVVRVSTNLSCLNDTIITRMAAMFTNVELEMVCDKKDRLLPRLWTKLIYSLFEPETEALRGHFYSLAGLFKCAKCEKCLTNTMKSYVQCIPGNVRLNRWGQIISHHVRDPSWDLNYYVTQLFKEVKSWRLVYWKLWGHAHYLYCCLCEMYFPVYQMSWCRYHPEAPSFLGPVAEGRITGPAGRYACCGQQAFRYETLPGPNGCQFREHSVLVETDRERSILSIVQLAVEGNALGDGPSPRMQESLHNGKIGPRWMAISLMPQRCRQGLLPLLNPDDSTNRLVRRVRSVSSKFFADSSTDTESTDTMDVTVSKLAFGSYNDSLSTSSSDGCESSESKASVMKRSHYHKKTRKNKPIENTGRYWSSEVSARSNQDHQREFEEKVMKQVISMVQKKTGSDLGISQQNRPLGGTFIKLEQEWKEQLRQRSYAFGSGTLNTQLNMTSNNMPLNTKSSKKRTDFSGP